MKKLQILLAFVIASAAFNSIASGQDFYNNKTIRIVVGFSPGGGMDIYARAIGRHLGKNIPGKPTVFVENMPGAGSLIAANYLYKQGETRWADNRKLDRRIGFATSYRRTKGD